MQIKVQKSFAYAYRGIDVHTYSAGEIVDVDAECAELAIEQGWAVIEGEKAAMAPANKAKRAPQNK